MTPRRKTEGADKKTIAGRPPRSPKVARLAGSKPAAVRGGGKAEQARPGLTRESIVAAALTIVDREGFEALSMRRLGAELGVNPMAVYYHVPNKSALLDALVEVVMTDIDLAVDDPSRPVEERLITAARVYREALLAHPSLIHIVAGRPPRTVAALRPVEALLGVFADAGFAPGDAMLAVNIFASYVRGAVVRQAPYWFDKQDSGLVEDVFDFSGISEVLDAREFPNLMKTAGVACHCGFDAEFDRGSRALIRGLLEMYGNKEVSDDV